MDLGLSIDDKTNVTFVSNQLGIVTYHPDEEPSPKIGNTYVIWSWHVCAHHMSETLIVSHTIPSQWYCSVQVDGRSKTE